jgi:hypothetical protein
MATYLRNDYGFTIGAHATVKVVVSWQNIPGVGPNHGPVVFTADPHSHLSDEVRLVAFDTAQVPRQAYWTATTESGHRGLL